MTEKTGVEGIVEAVCDCCVDNIDKYCVLKNEHLQKDCGVISVIRKGVAEEKWMAVDGYRGLIKNKGAEMYSVADMFWEQLRKEAGECLKG